MSEKEPEQGRIFNPDPTIRTVQTGPNSMRVCCLECAAKDAALSAMTRERDYQMSLAQDAYSKTLEMDELRRRAESALAEARERLAERTKEASDLAYRAQFELKRADQAEAQVAELTRALEPFAIAHERNTQGKVTLHHFRMAHEALASLPQSLKLRAERDAARDAVVEAAREAVKQHGQCGWECSWCDVADALARLAALDQKAKP